MAMVPTLVILCLLGVGVGLSLGVGVGLSLGVGVGYLFGVPTSLGVGVPSPSLIGTLPVGVKYLAFTHYLNLTPYIDIASCTPYMRGTPRQSPQFTNLWSRPSANWWTPVPALVDSSSRIGGVFHSLVE